MFQTLYNWYNKEEYDNAENLIGFLNDKISEINGKTDLDKEIKKEKISKLEISIKCIKYTYGI
jgi:hypothetical protein